MPAGSALGDSSRGLPRFFQLRHAARPTRATSGDFRVLIRFRLAVMAAICLIATPAFADEGQGFGRCRTGFADHTRVRTEARGDMTIGEVRVSDRVWSFNEIVGKPGWSRVLKRIDNGKQYKLLSEFSEPGSSEITRACWDIQRAS